MKHDHLKYAAMEERARAVLGVPIGAGRMEIKKAYWVLAMKYHPDRDPSDRSLQSKFSIISQAYEVLTSSKNMETRRLDDGDVGQFAKNAPIDYNQWWKERFFI